MNQRRRFSRLAMVIGGGLACIEVEGLSSLEQQQLQKVVQLNWRITDTTISRSGKRLRKLHRSTLRRVGVQYSK
jgi:hypothetical protein